MHAKAIDIYKRFSYRDYSLGPIEIFILYYDLVMMFLLLFYQLNI